MTDIQLNILPLEVKIGLICEGVFFLSGFSFTTNHESQDSRGMVKGISLTPHYHLHLLHRQLYISRAITAESSPLHTGSSRTRTGNL